MEIAVKELRQDIFCPVCGKKFEVNKSHLVYCSAECREVATKDKKKKYFKNYYSENRDKIIENNSINQKKKAGKI
jgi:predicted nucleic acid-binding Zn ribbon protein